MKVTISSSDFGKALSIAAQGAGTRVTLPVLGNLLLEADDGALRITGTNLEFTARVKVAAAVAVPGRTTVPADLLTDLITSFSAQPCELELDPTTQVLTVRCGQHRTRLHGIDADEFPPVREAPLDRAIEVDASTLATAAGQTVRCASRDEARPVLTGVLMRVQEDTLTLACTDGHRLAVRVIPATVPQGLAGTSLIVPARALERLAKVRVTPETVVTIALAEAGNHVHFTIADIEMASQVIEGAYPTYEPVIPTDAPTVVRATTALLLREVRTTSVLSPDAVGLITVVAADGGLTLRAQAAEVGQDEARVEADVSGPEVTIGFNAAYLRTALETVEAPEVTLSLTDALKPVVIRPAGDDSFLHVVMPIGTR
jgi:DNA polymerase-3 subunit beta